MISAILFISFFIFLVLGVPIGICLGLSSICAIVYSGTSLTIVATNMYSGISKFLLLAIPFFVLSGNIMAKAGISKRLIKFVDSCVGHRRGGIAIVCVIVACFFGAISGSGPATVAALGAVLIPAMVEQGGFSAPFATALMATASSIAIVIPPSIAFVVYASITGVSIGDMFMAGIVPGLVMGIALVIVVMIEARRKNIKPTQKKASAKERWDAFKDAFWGFLMPVIILGGIYGGIFTPTEAAAVSVVYGLFVGMVIYKEVTFKDLIHILVDSAKTTGGIMLIVASASLFSFVCTKFGIADAASGLLGRIATNQVTFLLIVNVIFLIAGCFIDANSAMYIFIPIMLPVCKALGYDLVAFGVLATVNLAIGQVTPPVGVNLFVAISIKIKKGLSVTLQQISKAVVPMIAASVAVLLLVTYVPAISYGLPKALAKDGAYTGESKAAAKAEETETAEEKASRQVSKDSSNYNDISDYSDLGWEEQTWNFACSTTETSTWAEGGRKFGELMEKATGGKVKVNIYAADQLTNGNQSEGIQALMNGDPVQISMHSNLIYSAFDPRFNVVSLPFIYENYDDADAKFDGEAGDALKAILSEYCLHCMGIAENGFRELTNNVMPVKSVDDMKNLKIRVAGSNLLMECYKRWGADATNMNWSETYTALQQKTVEGQENPLDAINAASVQEVQTNISMWDAIYDCLFFCINQEIYENLTPEQQAVVDEAGAKATDYQRDINRNRNSEILGEWGDSIQVTAKEEMDIDSFKKAVEGVDEWFVQQLVEQNVDEAEAQHLVDLFTKSADSSSAKSYEIGDYSDLDWEEQTWNFACSTTETSTWAEGGRKFGELVEKATGGKIKVNIYAADQLTNGNQSEGIQALMNGDPVQISMHSNLIYSAFDPRFNVVSLPFIYEDYADADAKFDGEAGDALKAILSEYGLHCMGIAENGFRELTNNVRPVESVDDMKNLKIRVAGSNLLMECYKRWGADATNMNWSETYTALQQKTVEGQENPLDAINAASVQEVQTNVSMWDAIYDCLFFCINQEIYEKLTPEQQAVIDEAGALATDYQREINRNRNSEIINEWGDSIQVTEKADMDIDSFKKAVEGVDEWFVQQLVEQDIDEAEAQHLVDLFTKEAESKENAESVSAYEIEDASDLDWEEQTWNFACSTTETSTWAEGGRKFGELMEKATGGKVKVNIYAADQLTNGNQSEGIQALMDGDPVQISMHSNLIYSAFDPRFNVVSLPFIYEDYADADAKFDGEAGKALKSILEDYGLHCMGIAENGFRELTNNVKPVKSVDDMKNLKIRVAGSNLLMECYKRWGADATNMNWSETYTALQQKTVEGQENPLDAINAASVQEVQTNITMWDAIYDCLFFCINQEIYEDLTPEQQAIVDKAGAMAVDYQREINRNRNAAIIDEWGDSIQVAAKEDLDLDSFKEAVEGVDDWFVEQLAEQGYADAQSLVDLFTGEGEPEDAAATEEATEETEGSEDAAANPSMADASDLDWEEQTWNFACSTTETSTWAEGGRKFGELMEQATGGKIKVNIYAADQLTNGNQSEGIQALMDGDPVQISMHSNLIYSAFDPRFNVVSLPFLYENYEDVDRKFDGEGGDKLKEILGSYGLHCMGIAENGFRELTNSKRAVTSVDDMKNLKIRVAGSNLLMECYKRWGADATNMNWSETYTALQQGTVEGQENPLDAINAASVQEVQTNISMWDAIYDCLFFCINQELYEKLTPEQQAVVDEAGAKAVA